MPDIQDNEFLNSKFRDATIQHQHHEIYAELCHDEDGYLVELGCRTCEIVLGVMHPKAALEMGGPDSAIGRAILEVFPEWIPAKS